MAWHCTPLSLPPRLIMHIKLATSLRRAGVFLRYARTVAPFQRYTKKHTPPHAAMIRAMTRRSAPIRHGP